jgi:ElaB/YqjD/DUF883 family membrane-anchored ribosome-binding protein
METTLTEKTKRVEQYAKEHLANAGDAAEVLVRHHPWKALGVVAVLSAVLGAVLGRALR